MRQPLLRRAAITAGAVALLGLAANQAASASAMSCFTVTGKMTCIDTASAAPATFMPPVIVPAGTADDGEHLSIVIEDDGGRSVARG